MSLITVHHEQAQIKADLRSREADTFGIVHRFEHIGAEFGKRVVELRDRLADCAKNLGGVFGDLSYCHKNSAREVCEM